MLEVLMLNIDLTDAVMHHIRKCKNFNDLDLSRMNVLRYLVDNNFKKRFGGKSQLILGAENHFEMDMDENEISFTIRLFYQNIWYKLDYKKFDEENFCMTFGCDVKGNPNIFNIESTYNYSQKVNDIKSVYIDRKMPYESADVEYEIVGFGTQPYFSYEKVTADNNKGWSRLQQLNLNIGPNAYYLVQNDGEQIIQDSKLEVTEDNLFDILNNPRLKRLPYSKNVPAYSVLCLDRIFYELKNEVSYILDEPPNIGR